MERGVETSWTVLAFGDVRVELGDDGVATVEVRRPPDNHFDVELIGWIADAYRVCDDDARCRAIVLCSEGRHFCAAADFSGGSKDAATPSTPWDPRDLYAAGARLFETSTPVVAAVQGAAIGGGLGVACTADLRVCTPKTRFCANFARLGIHHGFGLTATLPDIVGPQHARRLLLTSKAVRGPEALAIGLSDLMVEPEGLRAAARELAREVAGSAPLAVRSIKATLDDGRQDRFRDATERELAEQTVLFATSDFLEGVRAAAARREPTFEGR
jgi:2-(1,2-epoxy-1,2-dihydrophenyl)acetyl-CoA isomerase